MTREERALLMMAEQSTHTIGSGVTISERRDQEVGLNRIRNCPRNRERYKPVSVLVEFLRKNDSGIGQVINLMNNKGIK